MDCVVRGQRREGVPNRGDSMPKTTRGESNDRLPFDFSIDIRSFRSRWPGGNTFASDASGRGVTPGRSTLGSTQATILSVSVKCVANSF